MAHTLCFPFEWSAGLIPDKGDFYEESGEEAAWQRLSSWLASGQGELSQLFSSGGATLLHWRYVHRSQESFRTRSNNIVIDIYI